MIKTESTIFKYRVTLSKSGNSISHHEKRRMLRDAIVSSGLKYAQNKNQPKFSLGPGAHEEEASNCEYADICLLEDTNVEIIKQKLAPYITGGFKIEEIKEVPYTICSVEALASYARYILKGVTADTDKVLNCARAECEVIHDNGMRELLNIRPFIHSINKINGDEVELIIKLDVLRSIGLVQMLTKLPGLEVDERRFSALRSSLLWESTDGSLKAV